IAYLPPPRPPPSSLSAPARDGRVDADPAVGTAPYPARLALESRPGEPRREEPVAHGAPGRRPEATDPEEVRVGRRRGPGYHDAGSQRRRGGTVPGGEGRRPRDALVGPPGRERGVVGRPSELEVAGDRAQRVRSGVGARGRGRGGR
ncbi:hypothetical protein THAOC_08939, partial [Thalassiosira oceanica]